MSKQRKWWHNDSRFTKRDIVRFDEVEFVPVDDWVQYTNSKGDQFKIHTDVLKKQHGVVGHIFIKPRFNVKQLGENYRSKRNYYASIRVWDPKWLKSKKQRVDVWNFFLDHTFGVNDYFDILKTTDPKSKIKQLFNKVRNKKCGNHEKSYYGSIHWQCSQRYRQKCEQIKQNFEQVFDGFPASYESSVIIRKHDNQQICHVYCENNQCNVSIRPIDGYKTKNFDYNEFARQWLLDNFAKTGVYV